MDQYLVCLDIIIIYGASAVDDVLEDMSSCGYPYYRYYNNDQQGLLRYSYLMDLV